MAFILNIPGNKFQMRRLCARGNRLVFYHVDNVEDRCRQLLLAAYLDGHFVREIRKYSFVAQSPIRHKLGVRLIWIVLAGFAGWVMVPIPMPLLLAPMLIVLISYSLWLWVSNLQKRL